MRWGSRFRINGQSFKVIGVLAAKGGSGFGSTDDGIIVPLTTAQRKLFGGGAVSGGSTLVSVSPSRPRTPRASPAPCPRSA